MTTRRRRAGSDSCQEEPLLQFGPAHLPSTPSPQPPALVPQVKGAESVLLWGVSATSHVSDAYYKKTDVLNPSNSKQLQGNNYLPQSTDTEQYRYTGVCNIPLQPNKLLGSVPYARTEISNNVGINCLKYTHDSWNNNSLNSINTGRVVNDLNRGQISNSGYNHWHSSTIIKTISENSGVRVANTDSVCKDFSIVSAEDSDMASRDRTHEFTRIVRSQQGSYTNGTLPNRDRQPKDLRKYADFMQRAKLIGRNISSTYAKLEKLTLLAKNRSLFDDSQDREIQELTGIIRHDLSSLTKQLGDLRNRSLLDSSTGDSAHLQKHSSNLVGSLQTKVASITRMFKDVLEVRTENLKRQAQRREKFAGGTINGELPAGAIAGHHQGSVLLADEAAASSSATEMGMSNGSVAINLGGAYQQQLQMIEEQDTYLQSRADTMKTIESTIVELGQMFTQLASMVKEQEELVHRIDANVEDADLNVEAAHTELLKYFRSVSSNRWLMIKVFGVMIVFFVIFVVFMA